MVNLAERRMELGSYFREFREGGHISLRDAAGDLMSAAKLSRFERGATEMSTDTALKLMHRLGMMTSEFFFLDAENPYALPNCSRFARYDDPAKLTAQRERYERAHADDPDTVLRRIVTTLFDAAEAVARDRELPGGVADGFRLTVGQEQQLLRFLAYPKQWQTAEVEVLKCVLPFASSEFRDHIEADLEAGFIEKGGLLGRDLELYQAVLLESVRFAEWARFDRLWPRTAHRGGMYSLFLKRLRQWRDAGQPAAFPAVPRLLTATAQCGGRGDAAFLGRYWRLAHAPLKPWHRALTAPDVPELAADPVHFFLPLDAPSNEMKAPGDHPLTGARVANLRMRRQLSLEEASLAWSKSAQSRFEVGESQLGFVRTEVLKNFLLDGWINVIESDFNYNLLDAYLDGMANQADAGTLTDAAVAHQRAEFRAKNVGVVPVIQKMQDLNLALHADVLLHRQPDPALLATVDAVLDPALRWTTDRWLLFMDAAEFLSPARAYALWRSLVGADAGFQSRIVDVVRTDYYVALGVARAGDCAVAAPLLADLLAAEAHEYPWNHSRTLWLPLAQAVCRWTLAPGPETADGIAAYLRAMVETGHRAWVRPLLPELTALVGHDLAVDVSHPA